MAQMVNGSIYKGSETVCYRMSDRYAVVGEPLNGKHKKPQDSKHLERRKRNSFYKKLTIYKGRLVNPENAFSLADLAKGMI